jgi:hypothetical protein
LRRGHGGIRQVAEITGLHPETISRGSEELAQELLNRPTDRVRLPGGGRPRVEKKILPSKGILFAWQHQKPPAIPVAAKNGSGRVCAASLRLWTAGPAPQP